jgi:hypothetical protein
MLVIAGMHRSGTSALARSCNLLGVDLGSAFIPTQPDNEAGFWEDAGVKDADDLALASHGMLWDDVRPLPEPWCDGFGADEVRTRLRDTLAALARHSRLCGVKDPRISRLLPLWLPIFAELGVTPLFLIALREPTEVATSLARRDRLTPARSQLLWLRYTLEAELHTRGHRRWFVRFDDLLRDWRGALSCAARALGIDWPVSCDQAGAAIDTFLDPRLRHHVAPPLPAPVRAGVERWTQQAYATLLAMREDDTAPRRAELDAIRAALALGDVALAPVVAELEDEIATLRSGNGHVSDDAGRSTHERELDRARREALLAHELVGQRDRELEQAQAVANERASLLRQIDAANESLQRQQADIASLQQGLGALRGELDAQRAETAAALRVVADVERSLSWRLTSPLRTMNALLRARRAR